MKTKDIAARYRFSASKFDHWLTKTRPVPFKYGMMGGISIDDEADIDAAARQFESYLAEKTARAAEEAVRAVEEAAAAERYAQEKRRALTSMLVTSGFNFDGYKITKYSGYISGDDVVQVQRNNADFLSTATNVGDSLMKSLTIIRRNALAELKEAAYELGCNAVIGVDFDYLTFDPKTAGADGGTLYLPYVFGVTANGNAVIIEKS